jgi:ABC-type Zn uptake system ZnuABC Zn-binding protein ZnuA
MRTRSGVLTALPAARALLAALLATACSSATPDGSTGATGATGGADSIQAIGAENEYANVIQQIGGKYVQVTAIMSNPNTNPHTFEASPAVAREISNASLIAQNGVGYDTWASDIEKAVPASSRKQVTDTLTDSFIDLAHANGVPVVGVYETMPTPGYDYQTWMTAEVNALDKAVTAKVSTEHP